MRRPLAAACALAVVLTGCARGDDAPQPLETLEPQFTASSPSPRATAKDDEACKLLTSKERRSIAGEKIEVVAPGRPTGRVLSCLWVKSLATRSTSLKVVSQPVQSWARIVPHQVDGIIKSGRAEGEMLKRLQDAKKRVGGGVKEISDEEGCEMFSLLIEANNGSKDTRRFVEFLRTRAGELMIAWNVCGDGVNTVVTYAEPGLKPSFALSQAVLRLTKIAHKRAVRMMS